MKKKYLEFRNSWLLMAGVFMLSFTNAFGQAVVTQTFGFTGAAQTFIAPYCVGQVTIEVWGAEGGGSAISGNSSSGLGGKGGYSIGALTVSGGEVLNIYVGGYGASASLGLAPGGWNGGGSGYASDVSEPGNGGGGATDVRLNGNAFNNRIIVAGGGGGGGEDAGDTYGNGGGLSGVGYSGYDGSQTAPGAGGALGIGGDTGFGDGGGGGGGYYGGGTLYQTSIGADTQGGGGGSGYIGGVQNGNTIDGTLSMPNPSGGTMTGRSGNGFVRITYVSSGSAVAATTTSNTICSGQNAALTASSVVSYTWLPAGNFPGSTQQTINVNPTSSVTYTVEGTNATGCISKAFITITVNPLPTLDAAVNPTVPCVGGTTTLTASGANTYTWTGLSSSAPSVTVNPTITTSYNFSGTNQYGCVSSTVVAVNVNTNLLNISPNVSICAGSAATITAGNALTYTWSTGNRYATTYVNPSSTTVYTASGTDIHNCLITNTVEVTVNPKPNVTANASQTLICMGETVDLTAGGANTYVWSGNAGTTDKITVTLPYDVVYSYTVTGTGANGCKNTATVSVVSSKCSGLNSISGIIAGTRIYPNPSNGNITIEMQAGANSIQVMDLSGRVVLSKETEETTLNMSLENLAAGVYYFKVKSAEEVETIKVVKH